MGTPKGDVAVMLRQAITPGDVVVDVGASDGSLTRVAAEAAGATGRVLAFEPDGRYAWLEVLASYPTVEYFPLAVTDTIGSVPFYQAHTCQQSTLYAEILSAEQLQGVTQVRATCLDALDGPINVIKVDAQGAEVAVVKGARRWLNGSTTWIVEMWPAGLEAAQTSARELCELFWGAGYDVRWADGQSMTPETLAQFLRDVEGNVVKFRNISAVPKAA